MYLPLSLIHTLSLSHTLYLSLSHLYTHSLSLLFLLNQSFFYTNTNILSLSISRSLSIYTYIYIYISQAPPKLPFSIPEFYMGRSYITAAIYNDINNNYNCVCLKGVKGIGKTYILRYLCVYLNQRKIYDGGIYIISIPITHKNGISTCQLYINEICKRLCINSEFSLENIIKVLNRTTGKKIFIFENNIDENCYNNVDVDGIIYIITAIITSVSVSNNVKFLLMCIDKNNLIESSIDKISLPLLKTYIIPPLNQIDSAALFTKLGIHLCYSHLYLPKKCI